jgi:hypothetical protein
MAAVANLRQEGGKEAALLGPVELYCFETSGWLLLRAVLPAPTLVEISCSIVSTDGGQQKLPAGAAAVLSGHPTLRRALCQLMDDEERFDPVHLGWPEGKGWFSALNYCNAPLPFEQLDPPQLLTAAAERPSLQQWADGVHDPSRAYSHDRGSRICQAVTAVWVLGGAEGGGGSASNRPYVMVPGSHTAELPTPAALLRGPLDAHSQITTRPILRPGDLLLHAGTLVHAADPPVGAHLATCQFVTTITGNWSTDAPVPGGATPPEWMARLSPTQQAAMGCHPDGDVAIVDTAGHTARTPGPAMDDPRCTSVAGKRASTEERDVLRLGRLHPAAAAAAAAGGAKWAQPVPSSAEEVRQQLDMFSWDCCGHLILPGVMSSQWVAAALTGIDSATTVSADGSEKFVPPPGGGGLLGLPAPHAAPFAAMLDHPTVLAALQRILGPGWTVESPPHPTMAAAGAPPLAIHSGGAPTTPISLVRVRHGKLHCEVVKVAWQLRDVNLLRGGGGDDGGGGYTCIPGSHRARRPLPAGPGMIDREDPRANPTLIADGHLQLLRMAAGDVCIFLAASQAHGVSGWLGPQGRRCIIYGVWSRSRSRNRLRNRELPPSCPRL